MTLDTLTDFWHGLTNTSALIREVEELHAGKNQRISRYNHSNEYQERAQLFAPLIEERTRNNTKNLPYAIGRTLTLLANITSPRTGNIAEQMLYFHQNKPPTTASIKPGEDSVAHKILHEKARQHLYTDSTQIKDYAEKDYHELPVHPAAR